MPDFEMRTLPRSPIAAKRRRFQQRRRRLGGGGGPFTPILPIGVTLQAIDGETMVSGTTMSHNYYQRNGFSYAAAAGWDNNDFFPICLFLERIDNQANFNTWVDLRLNVALTFQGDSPALLQMRNNPGQIWAIPQANELLTQILPANGGVLGAETVGLHAADEPTSTNDAWQFLESTPNAYQNNRFWQITYLHTAIDFGDVDGTAIYDIMASPRTTPNGSQRYLTLGTTDHYFCAGAHYVGIATQVSSKFGRGVVFSQPEITEAQCRRPCHYGDYVRFMRGGNPNVLGSFASNSFFHNTGSFPIGTWIETGAPYTENTDANFVIKPAEINAAVWSTIINGARIVQYFSHSDAGFGDSLISGTFWKTPLPGETVSNYDQVKATNSLVKSLAPVLNSPFALGYVVVSPVAQYLSQTLDDAGFDVMAKLYGGKYYIFAMPRVAATTNQAATFTIKNTGGTVATVINEARTVPITAGTTFADVFATGNTIHIYRID